jgi:hypothetical protein
VLHFQRKRQKQFAEREAAGEILWTKVIQPNVAMRIGVGWSEVSNSATFQHHADAAFRHVLLETGIDVTQMAAGASAGDTYVNALTLADFAPSLIEAFILSLRRDDWATTDFEVVLNTIFAQERVAFEFIGNEIVEFDSKEMHATVVAPTLRLLSGRAGWDKVEDAYQKALKEIGVDPADAITDAGTALQEALAQLGCKGNALGPLGDDARKRGLLTPYDAKLVDWVSADRSGKGDAHNATPATRDDAWLAVHVVGALILRLAGDPNRVQ